VSESDKNLSEINVQLAVMDQVEKYLLSRTDEPGILPSTFGINAPILSDLLTKLSDLEVKYEGFTGKRPPKITRWWFH